VREVASPNGSEAATLAACVATILELPFDAVPQALADEDAAGWRIMRWLGGRGLGLVPVDDAASFSWAGPWIGWVRTADGERRAIVMYGVPSGVVWDPSGATERDGWRLEAGHVIAAQDVALAPPPLPAAPQSTGTIEGIFVAAEAGARAEALQSARALAGHGLEGDRHVAGTGTFPSGLPGSALTLIEAEVCDSSSHRCMAPSTAATSSRAASTSTRSSATSSSSAPCAAAACACASRARWSSATPPVRFCARSYTAADCAPTSSRTAS
jgi:hypothetical protein